MDANHQQQMTDFINALLEEYYPDQGDIDGGTFQDLAEKHGILIPEIRHEPCGEFCRCDEMVYDEEWTEGVKCYRAAAWLSGGAGEEDRPYKTAKALLDYYDEHGPQAFKARFFTLDILDVCRQIIQEGEGQPHPWRR